MSDVIEYMWGEASTCGRRPQNEDAHVIYSGHKPCDFTVVGIFDGHGGDSASKYAAQQLHQIIYQQKEFPDQMQKTLQQSFNIVDKNYIKSEGSSDIYSSAGTTACVALLHNSHIFFANAGDSRAIVGGNILHHFNGPYTQLSITHIAEQVTIDHKPHIPTEKERIEKYGSCVIQTDDDCSRVAGMLAVSRAIGDAPFKGCGVIAEPEVFKKEQSKVDFIIIACDGLWDVLSTGEVGFIVHTVLAQKNGVELKIEDSRLQKLYNGVKHFLASHNLCDEESYKAEKEIGSTVGLSEGSGGASDDIKASYETKDDKFSPTNIARILAKSAVALGSEDNVSVIVGVKSSEYK